MNIEIANRLLKLRKDNGLSQEQLAQKLGISRQAVSKWERAEAAPDTDNLIELAKLYNVSLDELLLNGIQEDAEKEQQKDEGYVHVGLGGIHVKDDKDSEVHVGFDGIHVKDDKDGEVHVSWNGIHVKDDKEEHIVDIDKHGVYVDGEKKEIFGDFSHNKKYDFPFTAVIFFGLLIYMGYTGHWHPAWVILLAIPLFDSLVTAIRKRRFSKFAYPILAVMIYLWIGFTQFIWHPSWVIFLTIPCYYAIAEYIDHKIKNFN